MVEEHDSHSRRHQVAQRAIDTDNYGTSPADIEHIAVGVVADLKRERHPGRTLSTWTAGRTQLRTSAE